MAEIRIGISGWTYAPWRGVFYPKELRKNRELEFASRRLNTIEINGSFYSLQRPTSYEKWYSMSPPDFKFAVKAGRFITHIRRLREIDQPLANFFASGILALKEKLGPVLWQFPPNMKFDAELFENFLRRLPRNTREAADLASRHDEWLDDRSYVEADKKRRFYHAVEVRNESFRTPEFFNLLKRHKVESVISHSSDAWPYFEEQTVDFVYARLHGEGELYSGGYGKKALDLWAKKIRAWNKDKRIKGIYVYFDNDAKIRAPFDALTLAERVRDLLPSTVAAEPKAA